MPLKPMTNLTEYLSRAREQYTWQDIDTAPTNGERFIGYGKRRKDSHYEWFLCCFVGGFDSGAIWYDGDDIYYLTKWMPLPSPEDGMLTTLIAIIERQREAFARLEYLLKRDTPTHDYLGFINQCIDDVNKMIASDIGVGSKGEE